MSARGYCIMHDCTEAAVDCTDPDHLRLFVRSPGPFVDCEPRREIDERGEPVRHAGTEAES